MLERKFSGGLLEFSSIAKIFVKMILIVIEMCVVMKVEQNLFGSKETTIFKSWTQFQCVFHIAIFTILRFRFSQLEGFEGKQFLKWLFLFPDSFSALLFLAFHFYSVSKNNFLLSSNIIYHIDQSALHCSNLPEFAILLDSCS